jgi:hypothetical protein
LLQQRLRILRPRRLRDLAAQPRDNLAQAATGRFVRWAALCAPLAHCSLLTAHSNAAPTCGMVSARLTVEVLGPM